MKTLNQDIKTGQFHPVYLLMGEESFLVQSYLKSLKNAIVGEDTMNLSSFYGKDSSVQEIIDAAELMPFFADRRLVVVEDSGLFKKDAGALPDYLDHLPETTIMIFADREVDKRNKLYKKVLKCGYIAEMNPQSERDLVRWLTGLAKREGYTLSPALADRIYQNIGDDMYRLKNELDKILSYAGERKVIEASDIDEVGYVQVTGHIFDLISAISAGDGKRIMKLYEELLTLQEAPMHIMVLLSRQYQQLLTIRTILSDGGSIDDAAAATGLRPFIAGKLKDNSKRIPTEELMARLEACAAADEAIKTGKMTDRIALESLFK